MLWISCCGEDAHIGYIVFSGEDDENDEEGDNGDSGRMDGDYEYEGSGDNEEERMKRIMRQRMGGYQGGRG